MPRPVKCRKVCGMPRSAEFHPADPDQRDAVVLTVDEYETIRLIDREGFTQEECAVRMEVGRTTIQEIYASARRKVAEMLVDARPPIIRGGRFSLCPNHDSGGGCCKKHQQCSRRNGKGE